MKQIKLVVVLCNEMYSPERFIPWDIKYVFIFVPILELSATMNATIGEAVIVLNIIHLRVHSDSSMVVQCANGVRFDS